MIRLVQRKLILPRGDTGSFTIPVLPDFNAGDVAVFAIFNPLNKTIIFKKQVEIADNKITIQFSHNDTVNLPAGRYLWDIKAYLNPMYADGELVNGDQIDSYYASYKLPECQIRETADNYLMADDAPTSALSSNQLDLLSAILAELRDAVQKSQENVTHYPTIIDEQWYIWNADTNQYVGTGVRVPARISDLIDDSGHYTKPANGIPANDIADGVIPDISVKADKVLNATSGNFASLDANGNLIDSGHKHSDYLTEHQDISGKQDKLVFDDAPQLISNNPVKSSGLWNAFNSVNNDITFINSQISSLQNQIIGKQDLLYFDTQPKANSNHPVTSSGIKTAIDTAISTKQNTLTFDDVPTQLSNNPVTSSGIKSALSGLEWSLSERASMIDNRVSSLQNDIVGHTMDISLLGSNITNLETNKQNKLTFDNTPTANSTNPVTSGGIYNAIANINTMDIHICTNQEYNSQTGIPTIVSPNTKTFYLVPGGEGSNLYIEWVYINNAWQQFGSATIDLSGYALLSDIPSNVSEFTNDAGYLTQHQNISGKADKTDTVLNTTLSRGRLNNSTIGEGSFAFGMNIMANGVYSHAEGAYTIASYPYSHAEGSSTRASNLASHAEGGDTTASGSCAHSEGVNTTASGSETHAEGMHTTASGRSAHAEGEDTIAQGNVSHAEGANTEATGGISHAEGSYTTASGLVSHTEGAHTTASGDYSHAEGTFTIAAGDIQHVSGKYNIEDLNNTYAEIVGIGTYDNARANGRTLDWNGNAWYAGKVSVGNVIPTEDNDLTSKEYVDETIDQVISDNLVQGKYKTISNQNIVTFDDAPENVPLKDVIIEIKPIQDLHGYDTPWLAGNGKNLLPDNFYGGGNYNAKVGTAFNNLYEGIEITKSENTYSKTVGSWGGMSMLSEPLTAGTYKVNIGYSATSGTRSTLYVLDEEMKVSRQIANSSSNGKWGSTITLTDTEKYIFVWLGSNTSATISLIEPMITEGSSVEIFAPYSNICPIYGRNKIQLRRTGKNLCGGQQFAEDLKTQITSAVIDAQNKTVSFSYSASIDANEIFPKIPFKENTRYTFIIPIQNNTAARSNLSIIYTDGSSADIPEPTVTEQKDVILFTSAANKTIKTLSRRSSEGTTIIYYNEVGVFEGILTQNDFVEYDGNTYDITFPSEAGTVYGGTLNITSGMLTVNKAMIDSYAGETLPAEWISDRDVYATGMTPTTGAQVVYTSEASQTYALAPQEVTALLGLNYIWANCGNTSITYASNVKAYIDSVVPNKLSDLIDDSGHYIKPASGIPASDLANNVIPDISNKIDKVNNATSGNFAGLDANGNLTDSGKKASDFLTSVPVTDIQINGTSILSNGVANIPYADTSAGVIKVVADGSYGVRLNTNKQLFILNATYEQVKAGGTNWFNPIVPATSHYSVFYGLAKAAGDTTQSQSDNTVGTYTNDAKVAIRSMLGTVGSEDYASSSTAGIVKVQSTYGVTIGDSSKVLMISRAASADIKTGTNAYKPIVPEIQHHSVFYGLAKAAGDSTQASSSNAVGTYTDDAKASIKTMLGVVGNADYATSSTAGIVKVLGDYGLTMENGFIKIAGATESSIKNGANIRTPIVSGNAYIAAFYGLAKAAGDTTQAASDNAVGTYTETAQSKIYEMLDAPVTVSGTDPVITGKAGVRYICGECDTLTFTPPASGIVDVVFTSGTTPTVLSVPSTVKWPGWFNPASLDASTTYELNIMDGVYGAVMAWT